MGRNPKSIRPKIIMALVVPVVALCGAWGWDVHGSVADALALRSAYDTRDQVWRPSGIVLDAMQAERSRSQEFLATGRREVGALRAQRAATDKAVAEFRRLSARYDSRAPAADVTRARLTDLTTSLGTLARLRTEVDAGSIRRAAALTGYSNLIGYGLAVLSAASSFADVRAEQIVRNLVAIGYAGELFSQEDALLTGAATAGRFGTGEYVQLIKIVGALHFQILTAGAGLPEYAQSAYFGLLNNSTFSALQATEDQIIDQGSPEGTVPVTKQAWKAIFDPAAAQLRDFLQAGYDEAITDARRAGDSVLIRFSVTVGLGLLAVFSSLFLAIRIGRSVVRRLSLLRTAAIDLAGRQLPEVVARLRAGEQVDVESEALRPPPGDDEITDVGLALGEVQRRAIESAVNEAALRYGMSKVFVNIARRNQSLIARQLEALALARASGTPDQNRQAALAEQLAIRMRRHAEHLVVLAGSARSRGGLSPVPLREILDSAVAEVQDSERIKMHSSADVALPGRVAADLVHMLAELMDNAIDFSPPDTPVRVSVQRLPRGVAIEIEDRGLGMTPAALEEINVSLAQPPDFDPANSARLGLVVVAMLANQRGIRVALQRSSFDGITAVLMIPPELADEAHRPPPAVRRFAMARAGGA